MYSYQNKTKRNETKKLLFLSFEFCVVYRFCACYFLFAFFNQLLNNSFHKNLVGKFDKQLRN